MHWAVHVSGLDDCPPPCYRADICRVDVPFVFAVFVFAVFVFVFAVFAVFTVFATPTPTPTPTPPRLPLHLPASPPNRSETVEPMDYTCQCEEEAYGVEEVGVGGSEGGEEVGEGREEERRG